LYINPKGFMYNWAVRKRYVIEHVNQKIKKYVRLKNRQDKLIITYASFVYLAIGMEFV